MARIARVVVPGAPHHQPAPHTTHASNQDVGQPPFRPSSRRPNHADETGWRTDAEIGYAWLFAAPRPSLFRFRRSRCAIVAAEVPGKKPLPGANLDLLRPD